MTKFETLKELYDNSIKSFGPNNSFSMLERESMSYNDFNDRVEYLGEMLKGAGISSGDKVALLSNNMPNWPVCYFACVTSGFVVVPILPDFSGDELDAIIAHSEAKALLVSDKLFSKLSKQTIESMNIVVRTKNLGVIARTCSQLGEVTMPTGDDMAVIIYTSGTTSKPKGVMLSHRALCTQVYEQYNFFPVNADDVFLSILPLSHTYECSVGMIYPFMVGASVVYLDRPPTASNLMPAFREVRPTIFLTVPLIIEKVFNTQVKARFTANPFFSSLYGNKFFRRMLHRMAGKKITKAFGGRIRFFGIGGAKLNAETERFLMDFNFPYAIGYGLTETAPLIAGAVPFRNKLESTGVAFGGVEIRLSNINKATGEGEIEVLTPCIMSGYFKNPEATAEAFTPDDWFRTKDLGYMDKDGYLFIRGRANNMIVGSSGENIYPEEIESVINTHKLVTESIVMEEKGHLVALVKFDTAEIERRYEDLKYDLKSKMEEAKAELMKYVNSKVSNFSRISMVVEQKLAFERTPTNKIKRYLYTKKQKAV